MGELLYWNPQVLGRKAHEARGKQIGRSRKAIELAQMKACESDIEIKKDYRKNRKASLAWLKRESAEELLLESKMRSWGLWD